MKAMSKCHAQHVLTLIFNPNSSSSRAVQSLHVLRQHHRVGPCYFLVVCFAVTVLPLANTIIPTGHEPRIVSGKC